CALQPLQSIVGNVDVVAFDLEVVAQPEGQVGVVFDDEDARRHASLSVVMGSSSSCSGPDAGRTSASTFGECGSSTKKREPRCSRLCRSTPARPPWRCTRSRTTANPIPLP